ncbi:MAG: DUF86 domain-containing protein [Clostridiales bacterium]|nr:DUF86 domain-containing protein [Clostridiales bacterium]
MRNLVAHDYGNMDRETIWETAIHEDSNLTRRNCL